MRDAHRRPDTEEAAGDDSPKSPLHLLLILLRQHVVVGRVG